MCPSHSEYLKRFHVLNVVLTHYPVAGIVYFMVHLPICDWFRSINAQTRFVYLPRKRRSDEANFGARLTAKASDLNDRKTILVESVVKGSSC